jgi:AraC family transcriptional regulator
MQEPRIETKAPIRLVGLQTTFISGLSPDTNAPEVIGPLWGGLNARMAEIQRSDEKTCYGYSCYGAPAERTRDDELLYLAGAPVAADAPVPEGLVSVETAGGLYAVFEHRGPIWNLGATIKAIYAEWLPNSGYQGSDKGDVELYDERWSADGEDSILEYWVGIEKAPA